MLHGVAVGQEGAVTVLYFGHVCCGEGCVGLIVGEREPKTACRTPLAEQELLELLDVYLLAWRDG